MGGALRTLRRDQSARQMKICHAEANFARLSRSTEPIRRRPLARLLLVLAV
jgi:hypothetical protein